MIQLMSRNPVGFSPLLTLGIAWKPAVVDEVLIKITDYFCTFLSIFPLHLEKCRFPQGCSLIGDTSVELCIYQNTLLIIFAHFCNWASLLHTLFPSSNLHMTLEKDLAVLSSAGMRAEIIPPILCPPDLLDHHICSSHSSATVSHSESKPDLGVMGWQWEICCFSLIINLTLLG